MIGKSLSELNHHPDMKFTTYEMGFNEYCRILIQTKSDRPVTVTIVYYTLFVTEAFKKNPTNFLFRTSTELEISNIKIFTDAATLSRVLSLKN